MYGTTPVGTEPGWLWPVSPVSVIWLATTAWYPLGVAQAPLPTIVGRPWQLPATAGVVEPVTATPSGTRTAAAARAKSWRASLREALFMINYAPWDEDRGWRPGSHCHLVRAGRRTAAGRRPRLVVLP